METQKFTPMFKVYKKGVTVNEITILKNNLEKFNESKKREKYIFLGYTITEINQK
jgi:hypothetical protein